MVTLRFFITSVSRTGTKWLVWLLNQSPTWDVLHDSMDGLCSTRKCGIIAPGYLNEIFLHKEPIKHIILRNPEEVAVSLMNTFEFDQHIGYLPCLEGFVHNLVYLTGVMKAALDDGVQPVDYHQFCNTDYMNSFVQSLGIDDLNVNKLMISKRINRKPGPYRSFSQVPDEMKFAVENYLRPVYNTYYSLCF